MTDHARGAESPVEPSAAVAPSEPGSTRKTPCGPCAKRAAAYDGQLADLAGMVEAGQVRAFLWAGGALGVALAAAFMAGAALFIVLKGRE